jgi:TatD DNase family protein
MLVDSHCHLDMLTPVKEGAGLDAVLEEAAAAGVRHFLCVGVHPDDQPAMLAVVGDRPQVSVSAGLHPCGVTAEEPDEAALAQLAAHPKAVAVGETGLDYYHRDVAVDVQQARFRRHIRVAKRSGLPLIVHTRDARADTLRILREEGAADVGGVFHCFTEDEATARAALDLGFHISFSGIVTFRAADPLREVARLVPVDRLLVETDAPYLAPTPMRGKENRPAWVRHVAECVARERGATLDALAERTTENFFRLFARARRADVGL